ncbi:hypothetical protein N8A98_00575 (plasmid) [Devosia neptuniae]|uniref:Histidine kinase/HSP90-like ATPase domain-containing protein n=1 Tax=Devosia neptuniae TaxID=191302 RepID=A0ABY6C722_9HYPH|nr:hypothetical protein [Devosia neptuniae]UXN68047.1 hypothetical protein N8A98_00575 [Devosia neptuniae]
MPKSCRVCFSAFVAQKPPVSFPPIAALPTGLVDVSCSARDDAVTVVWTERGGPPVVQSTAPAGYGTRLVERSITSALRGSIQCDWAEDGLVVTLKIDPERLAV